MFEYLLTDEQKALQAESRDFVKSIPRKMILDMDKDKIQFPKEFLQKAGQLNLMGDRYPKEWGGRGMDWVSTCMVMEEVGVLAHLFVKKGTNPIRASYFMAPPNFLSINSAYFRSIF